MARQKSKQKVEYQTTLFGFRMYEALTKEIPLVFAFVSNSSEDFISLRISYRGPGDYLAIGKRYAGDGAPEVIFGSGPDFIGCLAGLEVALDQDKWRPDKYAKGTAVKGT